MSGSISPRFSFTHFPQASSANGPGATLIRPIPDPCAPCVKYLGMAPLGDSGSGSCGPGFAFGTLGPILGEVGTSTARILVEVSVFEGFLSGGVRNVSYLAVGADHSIAKVALPSIWFQGAENEWLGTILVLRHCRRLSVGRIRALVCRITRTCLWHCTWLSPHVVKRGEIHFQKAVVQCNLETAFLFPVKGIGAYGAALDCAEIRHHQERWWARIRGELAAADEGHPKSTQARCVRGGRSYS